MLAVVPVFLSAQARVDRLTECLPVSFLVGFYLAHQCLRVLRFCIVLFQHSNSIFVALRNVIRGELKRWFRFQILIYVCGLGLFNATIKGSVFLLHRLEGLFRLLAFLGLSDLLNPKEKIVTFRNLRRGIVV